MIAPVHAPVRRRTPTKRASASVRDWPVGRPASFFSARASSGAASLTDSAQPEERRRDRDHVADDADDEGREQQGRPVADGHAAAARPPAPSR